MVPGPLPAVLPRVALLRVAECTPATITLQVAHPGIAAATPQVVRGHHLLTAVRRAAMPIRRLAHLAPERAGMPARHPPAVPLARMAPVVTQRVRAPVQALPINASAHKAIKKDAAQRCVLFCFPTRRVRNPNGIANPCAINGGYRVIARWRIRRGSWTANASCRRTCGQDRTRQPSPARCAPCRKRRSWWQRRRHGAA